MGLRTSPEILNWSRPRLLTPIHYAGILTLFDRLFAERNADEGLPDRGPRGNI